MRTNKGYRGTQRLVQQEVLTICRPEGNMGKKQNPVGADTWRREGPSSGSCGHRGPQLLSHTSVCSHSVLLFQTAPPIHQTQPELGVREFSDAVHGEPPLRSKSMTEKGRE